MTLRAPHFTRIGPREGSKELLTWTHGVQPGLNPTPFIQRQWDWPNPVRRIEKTELRTWLHSQQIPQPVAGQSPFNQYAWPNPIPRAANMALRSWIGPPPPDQVLPFVIESGFSPDPGRRNSEFLTWIGQGIRSVAVVTNPFAQRDWPLPPQRPPNLELRTWIDGLPQTALSLTLPQRQTDWPNPAPKAPNLELRSWTDGPPQDALSNTIPQGQYDWPNPAPKRRDHELLTWVDGLPQSALSLTVPPVQLDWPNPVLRKSLYELRTWISWTQIQPAAPKPFLQTEWPNPVLAKANLELRDWKQGLPPGQIAKTVPPVQLDWPNPIISRKLRIDWVTESPIVLGIPDAPIFVQGEPHPDLRTTRKARTLRARRSKRTEH